MVSALTRIRIRAGFVPLAIMGNFMAWRFVACQARGD
jgi:hypothetical protein